MRPMTEEEAWKHISGCYWGYHNTLKKYGYRCWNFIPKTMYKSFSNPNLSAQDIDNVHKNFIEVYNNNFKELNRFDDIFESYVKIKLESAINEFLLPLLSSWNTTLPNKLEILCTFGNGASPIRKNDKEAIISFRMSRFPNDKDTILNILFHEFVHILTHESIFLKYNVPENIEERVVDLICYECIKKPVQKMFENSFANAYITPETIKTDLPGAVKKMMTDYKILQQKQMQQGQSL